MNPNDKLSAPSKIPGPPKAKPPGEKVVGKNLAPPPASSAVSSKMGVKPKVKPEAPGTTTMVSKPLSPLKDAPGKSPEMAKAVKAPAPPKNPIKTGMGFAGAGAVHGLRAHAHGVSHCFIPVGSGVSGFSVGGNEPDGEE